MYASEAMLEESLPQQRSHRNDVSFIGHYNVIFTSEAEEGLTALSVLITAASARDAFDELIVLLLSCWTKNPLLKNTNSTKQDRANVYINIHVQRHCK